MAQQERQLRVFMDICTPFVDQERLIFELFYDLAPFTAENFRLLCTGEIGCSPKTGKSLSYGNCFFHKVKEGSSYLKAGKFSYESGEDGKSVETVYGPVWPEVDSNDLKHNRRGLLSMSCEDKLAACSNFLMTLKADESLDRSNVVFGMLVEGFGTLGLIEASCSRFPIQIKATGLLFDDSIPSHVIVRTCWPSPTECEIVRPYGWESGRSLGYRSPGPLLVYSRKKRCSSGCFGELAVRK